MAELIRCFIAIEPPDKLRKALSALAAELKNEEGIVPVSEQNIHITLKFLGGISYDKIAEAESKLREIRMKPFTVRFTGVGVFPNEDYIRVVWVGCEGDELDSLAKEINSKLAGMFAKEGVTAHLTIARVKRKVNLRTFLEKHKNQSFGEFTIDKFLLKSSQLSRSGPTYSTISEFSLFPS